ncbi:MAG: hypothetical protein ABSA04_07925 [Desulfobaccales bacterium]
MLFFKSCRFMANRAPGTKAAIWEHSFFDNPKFATARTGHGAPGYGVQTVADGEADLVGVEILTTKAALQGFKLNRFGALGAFFSLAGNNGLGRKESRAQIFLFW